MAPPKRYTNSLILSGGGSYSSYEIGVMKALFAGHSPATNHTPLNPDLLIGTSAGAMNAAGVLAQEVRTGSLVAAIEELQAIWTGWIADGAARCGNGIYRIRWLPFNLLNRYCLQRGLTPFVDEATDDANVLLRGSVQAATSFVRSFLSPGAQTLRTLARAIDFSAFIVTAPYLETLRIFMPLEDFARSTRGLRIIAMDLTAGHLRLFDEDDVRRLGFGPVLASTALPIFFPPHEIDGHDFVNPTTLATTPLLPAISESDTMHLVYMDPDLRSISRARLENVVDAMDRVLVVNFAYMLNRDIQRAQEINTALALIEEGVTADSLSSQDVHALLRSLADIEARIHEGNPYRPLTIHRYHPRDDLGSDLGLMNLERHRIEQIIDRGYADTVAHDCVASGCIFPGRPAIPSPPPAAAARPVAPEESPPIPR